jgi:hypothetical protein
MWKKYLATPVGDDKTVKLALQDLLSTYISMVDDISEAEALKQAKTIVFILTANNLKHEVRFNTFLDDNNQEIADIDDVAEMLPIIYNAYKKYISKKTLISLLDIENNFDALFSEKTTRNDTTTYDRDISNHSTTKTDNKSSNDLKNTQTELTVNDIAENEMGQDAKYVSGKTKDEGTNTIDQNSNTDQDQTSTENSNKTNTLDETRTNFKASQLPAITKALLQDGQNGLRDFLTDVYSQILLPVQGLTDNELPWIFRYF